MFGNVGALQGLKEKKPGLIIGLCGCMANQKHVVEKLRQSYPYVDLVFGVDGIDTLPQLIAQKPVSYTHLCSSACAKAAVQHKKRPPRRKLCPDPLARSGQRVYTKESYS